MDERRLPLDDAMRADDPHHDEHGVHEVRPDVGYQRIVFVNLLYVGSKDAGDRNWVLVDAGVTKASESKIEHTAEARFGKGARPAAIVLTHGHFDHVGAVQELAEAWVCPVYAHPLELPYLDGRSPYPDPDPSVGGGMLALSSGIYPKGPIDLGEALHPLPEDGSVPGMPGWRWIHAPGHSVGQVALWRESDRTLIAADAFVTTDQESLYAALTQKPELQGPPAYFTCDWEAARETVKTLAALEPESVITGHGQAMRGEAFRARLRELAADFDRIAVPGGHRYVEHPARVEDGTAYPGR